MKQYFSIPYINLKSQHDHIKHELLLAIEETLSSGQFILGTTVRDFEKQFAEYCGTKYAVGVGSGTDALVLSMKASGIGSGDEVITSPNSFLASASAIALTGATPVFVDVKNTFNLNPELLEASITSKTKAIMPVHLTGRPSELYQIQAIAEKNGLVIIEDAAQAVGARYHEKRVGSFGIAGCFSFHPLKNLNACGDGGIIVTNDELVYKYLIKARNHGLINRNECEFWSLNSRLDTIQAAILRLKLKNLDSVIKKRREHADFYRHNLADVVEVPQEQPFEHSAYQTFMIQADQRDNLQNYLSRQGVETVVHYHIPIHLQKAAKSLGYKSGDFPVTEHLANRILSLPVYPELTINQLDYIAKTIREFYER